MTDSEQTQTGRVRVDLDGVKIWTPYYLRVIDVVVFPDVGIDVDQGLVDEYKQVFGAWRAMQAKLQLVNTQLEDARTAQEAPRLSGLCLCRLPLGHAGECPRMELAQDPLR